jgi:hypothetical protein
MVLILLAEAAVAYRRRFAALAAGAGVDGPVLIAGARDADRMPPGAAPGPVAGPVPAPAADPAGERPEADAGSLPGRPADAFPAVSSQPSRTRPRTGAGKGRPAATRSGAADREATPAELAELATALERVQVARTGRGLTYTAARSALGVRYADARAALDTARERLASETAATAGTVPAGGARAAEDAALAELEAEFDAPAAEATDGATPVGGVASG